MSGWGRIAGPGIVFRTSVADKIEKLVQIPNAATTHLRAAGQSRLQSE